MGISVIQGPFTIVGDYNVAITDSVIVVIDPADDGATATCFYAQAQGGDVRIAFGGGSPTGDAGTILYDGDPPSFFPFRLSTSGSSIATAVKKTGESDCTMRVISLKL